MKNTLRLLSFILGLVLMSGSSCLIAQSNDEKDELIKKLSQQLENLNHRLDRIEKISDDILWYNKVGDIAFIDKVYIYGPPKWKEKNPTAQGAGNPVKFWTYTFIPKDIDPAKNTTGRTTGEPRGLGAILDAFTLGKLTEKILSQQFDISGTFSQRWYMKTDNIQSIV